MTNASFRDSRWPKTALSLALVLAQISTSAFAFDFADKQVAPDAAPVGAAFHAGESISSINIGQESLGDSALASPEESRSLIEDKTPDTVSAKRPSNTNASQNKKVSAAKRLAGKQSRSPEKARPVSPDQTQNRKNKKKAALRQLKQWAKELGAKPEVSGDWVENMTEENAKASPETKRLRDAVENLGFSNVALNRSILAQHDPSYTNAIPDGTITNQASSGRCWIFAGCNMIRSTLLAEKRLPNDFEFSENYIFFFSKLEKANSYFEDVMKAVFSKMGSAGTSSMKFRRKIFPDTGDGGWFNWFQFLVSKYGLAPKSAMAETASSKSSALMNSELKSAVAIYTSEMLKLMKKRPSKAALQEAFEAKARALSRVWKILSTHLGTPPTRFNYRENAPALTPDARKVLDILGQRLGQPGLQKTQITPAAIRQYSPQEFAKDYIKFNPSDYVTLGNFSRKKDGVVYELKDSALSPGAQFPLRFVQTSSERMAELVAASIDAGRPVWFGSEMGRQTDNTTGIMHPDIYDPQSLYGFSKEEKTENLSKDDATYLLVRQLNHAMAITGYDRPDPKNPIVKFRVENSWGDQVGSKGIYHMYLEWFNQNVYQVIIHKSLLNDAEKKTWDGKAENIKWKEL